VRKGASPGALTAAGRVAPLVGWLCLHLRILAHRIHAPLQHHAFTRTAPSTLWERFGGWNNVAGPAAGRLYAGFVYAPSRMAAHAAAGFRVLAILQHWQTARSGSAGDRTGNIKRHWDASSPYLYGLQITLALACANGR